jgi:hypothetical protein
MPEIQPELSDQSRCISVHWSLPVQCVLPCTHRENWHEAWHPDSGNRIRYRRAFGVYRTEELHDGGWHDLDIPPPGDVCGEPYDRPGVFCQAPRAHNEISWTHGAVVDGCSYTWNTPRPAYKPEQVAIDLARVRAIAAEANLRLGVRVEERDRLENALDAAVRSSIAKAAELQARVDDLTGQVAGQSETIQRVRDRHSEYRIYDECGHGHDADEPGIGYAAEIGFVCEDGYMYSVCRECCTADGEHTEHCATDHVPADCWPCRTRKDIDGDPADDGSAR